MTKLNRVSISVKIFIFICFTVLILISCFRTTDELQASNIPNVSVPSTGATTLLDFMLQ